MILNTTVSGGYDSNLFARNDADGDVYLSVAPELQFLRQAGKGTIDFSTGVDITRFVDLTEEDFEDLFASFDVTYPVHPDSPLSGGIFAAFTQQSAAIDLVNTRVRTETTSVGADTLYRVSERLGLRNNLTYEHTDIEEFSNIKAYAGKFGLQWFYSEKLSFFGDYRIRQSQSSGENPFDEQSVDNLDHTLFFGAVGDLRPRVTGTAALGYQHTDAQGAESDGNLFVASADLLWDWRPRTRVRLNASRDVDVSPTDETVETTSVSLELDHDIDPKITLTGMLGYRDFSFRGAGNRQDDAVFTGAGLRYVFTRYWNAGLNYDFTLNSSNTPEADFTRHLVQLFTHYSF